MLVISIVVSALFNLNWASNDCPGMYQSYHFNGEEICLRAQKSWDDDFVALFQVQSFCNR